MMWAIKHKSGRVLFVTSDEFIADNRRKMGWIVELIMSKCPKCNGTGMADSGGVQSWGEPILIECDCVMEELKMTSREQFEEWFLSEHEEVENSNELSAKVMKMMAWQSWQASRAAIEIEIPEVYGNKYTPSSVTMDGFDFEEYIDDLQSNIRAAGLKVKGE